MEENKGLRGIIASTSEQRAKRLETFKDYVFYGIIAVVLLIVTFIVPLISGGIQAQDFSYYLPKSVYGWVVFWLIRGGTVLGNMCVYGLFKAQAKRNSMDNKKFIEAEELLKKMKGTKGFVPRSPHQKLIKDWTVKGVWVLLTTAFESIVIGTLIINFDIMTFLSCITSSITAVMFGIVAMIQDEVYWTDEYLDYAKMVTENIINKEEADNNA